MPPSWGVLRESRDISINLIASFTSSRSTLSARRSLARAVANRKIASSVLADVYVVSLELRASLRISTYAPVM